jgi:hypothetical protein
VTMVFDDLIDRQSPPNDPARIAAVIASDQRFAKELAICRSNAGNDFPLAVKRLLSSSPEFHKAELVDGIFEREVDLGTAGRNSQTDLMGVIGIEEKLGVIAVEG